jgi:hypothetical protein
MTMTKWILVGALVLAVSGASAQEAKRVKPAPKAVASGQMLCTAQGCRPVQPGCHIEMRVYLGMSGSNNVEVCK